MKLKKIIQISILLLLLTTLVFALTGCSDDSEDLNGKAYSEIEYLGTKFINILNRLNNITFENYQITTEEITLSKESAKQSKASSSSSSQSSGGGSNELGKSGEGSSGGDTNTNSIIASQMSPNTILNPTTDTIDWAGLKNEMENMYEAWDTILLDLYQLNINSDEILGFSATLDKATTYIKNEDKANSLLAVADLYSYLPKYLETISQETAKKNISKTKSFIINAYSLVEIGDWNEIRGEVAKADEAFRLVTTDANFVSSHSYQVNKSYVLLNELKNSLALEDKEIFYIKYRNLLEEINTL